MPTLHRILLHINCQRDPNAGADSSDISCGAAENKCEGPRPLFVGVATMSAAPQRRSGADNLITYFVEDRLGI
jgi:hypothetical protein